MAACACLGMWYGNACQSRDKWHGWANLSLYVVEITCYLSLCGWQRAPEVWGQERVHYILPAQEWWSDGHNAVSKGVADTNKQHLMVRNRSHFSTLSGLSSPPSSSTKVNDSQLILEAWPGELWPLSKTRLWGESHQSKRAWSSVLSIEPSRIIDSAKKEVSQRKSLAFRGKLLILTWDQLSTKSEKISLR